MNKQNEKSKRQTKKSLLPDYENEVRELKKIHQHFPDLNTDSTDIAVKLEKIAKYILVVVEVPFSKFNISRVGFFILMCLKAHPPINHASKIAAKWGVERTAVGKATKTLEKAGYIKRCIDPNDRRAGRITMTDEGERLFENVSDEYSNWLLKVFGKLNDIERECLTQFALETKNLLSSKF